MTTRIESLLGQEDIIEGVVRQIDGTRSKWHLLEGPAGCGKSWVLGQVQARWVALGFPLLRLNGDRIQENRAYFPFLGAIARNPTTLPLRRLTKKSISEAGTMIPVVGSVATLIVDALLSSRERKQTSRALFLNELEHEILFHLQEIAKAKPLLLLADDLQYWDSSSINLIESLADNELLTAYPFLRELRFLGSVTSNFQLGSRTFSRELPFRYWRLDYFPPDHFAEVLEAFGAGGMLTIDDLKAIYSICGGHLEIIKRLAEYLAAGKRGIPALNIRGVGLEELLSSLMEDRFGSFGIDGEQLVRLLEIAAIAGTRFSQEEIQCLLGAVDSGLMTLIPKAKAAQLLRDDGGGYTAFTHELIQRHFQRRVGARESELHKKFASCIARLRPADYASRALHLVAAGYDNAANRLQFLALLQALREGEDRAGNLLADLCAGAENESIRSFYKCLTEAYRLFFDLDVARARHILERIEDDLPSDLLVEKDYLLALCLKRSPRTEDRSYAKRLLKAWEDLRELEGEQWFRLFSTLAIIHADDGEFGEAKLCERSLVRHLSERINYDPFAASGLNRLRRKCSALHSAEIAAERCRAAAEYFGPVTDVSSPRNPLQYYLALANLSGNLIVTGSFAQARATAQEALEVIREFPRLSRRPEIPINNLIVAAFLSGAIPVGDAVVSLSEALKVSRGIGEIVLLVNNIAVLKIHAGKHAEAREDLEAILSRSDFDDYYGYFVRSNLVALRFLASGDRRWAKAWEEIPVPRVPEGDRILILRRHDLQKKAFVALKIGQHREWDRFLKDNYSSEIGPAWSFFGRGFLFSDMQFWAEA
jgi:hypothetical protein